MPRECMRTLIFLAICCSSHLCAQRSSDAGCSAAIAKMNEMTGLHRSSEVLQELVAKATNRIRVWRSLGRTSEVAREFGRLEERLSTARQLPSAVSAELQSAMVQVQRACGEQMKSAGGPTKCQIRARLIKGTEVDIEANSPFDGSAVIIGDLVIGSLDSNGRIDFNLEPGKYDITLCLRGGNIGTAIKFSTESPSVVVDLDSGKEIYLEADTVVREQSLGRPPRTSNSLEIALRDPATDEIITISRATFEILIRTDTSDVDLTKLFQLNRAGLMTADLIRLKKEMLKAGSNRIVIHAEDSRGRQWHSKVRLAALR